MRQTELEKPILYGEWTRQPSANPKLIRQSRKIWADGKSEPVAVEYHLATPDGNFRDWVAIRPEYWSCNIQEKLTAYLKATRPELFRKPKIRKVRKPQERDENGKFIKKAGKEK